MRTQCMIGNGKYKGHTPKGNGGQNNYENTGQWEKQFLHPQGHTPRQWKDPNRDPKHCLDLVNSA